VADNTTTLAHRDAVAGVVHPIIPGLAKREPGTHKHPRRRTRAIA
jgi:hypothetical protein